MPRTPCAVRVCKVEGQCRTTGHPTRKTRESVMNGDLEDRSRLHMGVASREPLLHDRLLSGTFRTSVRLHALENVELGQAQMPCMVLACFRSACSDAVWQPQSSLTGADVRSSVKKFKYIMVRRSTVSTRKLQNSIWANEKSNAGKGTDTDGSLRASTRQTQYARL